MRPLLAGIVAEVMVFSSKFITLLAQSVTILLVLPSLTLSSKSVTISVA